MPSISYHAANGRVRATTTSSGFRAELLPDALGSVVRTANVGTSAGRSLRYLG